MLRAKRHLRLINVDKGLQWVASGIDQSAPVLPEQDRGGLVTVDAQLVLQLKDRDAGGMGGDNMRDKKPCLERHVVTMHHGAGAGSQRGLPPTPCALGCIKHQNDLRQTWSYEV